MTPKQLKARFQYMFSGENIGISIARGWMPGFQILCERIDALLGEDKRGFHWTQCKEKFGAARFYWSMEGNRPAVIRATSISNMGVQKTIDETPKTGKPEFSIYEQIDSLVNELSDRTQHMCIVCGKPGKGNRQDAYVLILCDEHARLRAQDKLPDFWFDEDEDS